MRQSKGVKTHLSTQKYEQSFEKSAKERKKSKNLYTLNKESDDDDSNQTSQFDKNYENQKGTKKSRKVSVNKENGNDSQQSDNDSQNHKGGKNQNMKIKAHLQEAESDEDLDQQSSNEVDDYANEHEDEEQRVKKYLPFAENDKESLKIHMTIKHLEQQNQLLNNSLLAHENRQQQMVGRYAKLQAQNKRLQFQIVKISKSNKQKKLEEQYYKKSKQQVQSTKKVNQQILGYIENENMRIITYLKGLITKLVNDKVPLEKQQESKKQTQSVGAYVQKCLSTLKQTRKTIFKKFALATDQASKQNVSNNNNTKSDENNQKRSLLPDPATLDLSYERQRIIHLNEQNSKLSNQLKRIKEQFNKLSQSYKKSTAQRQSQFRQEKKQLCEKYNQAIEEIKTKYRALEGKIQEQEEKYEIKVQELEKAVGFKDKVIKKLKQQLKDLNVKLDEIQQQRFELMRSSMSRRQPPQMAYQSYKSKKKYIDGDFLNESLLSNKQKPISRDHSFQNSYKNNEHEESLCEYQPQRKKKRKEKQIQSDNVMMRKSHKNKKTDQSYLQASRKEEEDLEKINREIEDLERQILEEFQSQA